MPNSSPVPGAIPGELISPTSIPEIALPPAPSPEVPNISTPPEAVQDIPLEVTNSEPNQSANSETPSEMEPPTEALATPEAPEPSEPPKEESTAHHHIKITDHLNEAGLKATEQTISEFQQTGDASSFLEKVNALREEAVKSLEEGGHK